MALDLEEILKMMEESVTPIPPRTPEAIRRGYYDKLFRRKIPADANAPEIDAEASSRTSSVGSLDWSQIDSVASSRNSRASSMDFVFRAPSDEILGEDNPDPKFDSESSEKAESQEKGLYEMACISVMAEIESEDTKAQVHLDKMRQFEGFKEKRKEHGKETLSYLQELDNSGIEIKRNTYTTNTVGSKHNGKLSIISVKGEDRQRLWDVACFIRNKYHEELNQGLRPDLERIQANLQSLANFDITIWNVADTKKDISSRKAESPMSITRVLSTLFLPASEDKPSSKKEQKEAEVSPETQVKRRELKFPK